MIIILALRVWTSDGLKSDGIAALFATISVVFASGVPLVAHCAAIQAGKPVMSGNTTSACGARS